MSNKKATYQELEKEVKELQAKLSEPLKKENEENFRNLFETSRDGIAMTDMDGHITNCNKAFLTMLCYDSMEKIQNKSYEQITPIEYHQKEKKIIEEETLVKGYCDEYEKEYIRNDGSRIPVRLRAWLRKNHKNIPIGMWVMVRDITERKQAEQDLKESDEKFRRILENAENMIYRISLPSGKFEFVSKAATKLAGCSMEEIYNSSFIGHKMIHPEWNEYYESGLKDLLKGKIKPSYEYKIIDGNGKEKWLYQRSKLIYGDHNKPIAIEGIVSDITERKNAEQVIKDNEKNIRTIVNSLPASVALVDEKGKILQVNDRWVEFAKNNSLDENLVPYTDFNYFEVCKKDRSDENAQKALKGLKEVLNDKLDHFDLLYPCHSPNKERWFLMRAVKLQSQERQILVSHLDITEQKQAEQALKENEEKLRIWINNSPICTKIVDLDFNLKFMSDSGIKELKIDDITKYYGKPYPFHFYPDSFKVPMRNNLGKVKKTGKTITQEASVLDVEGNELWYHSTIIPVFKHKNEDQLDYIMIVSLEITDRKKAELSLKENESRLKELNADKDKFMSILAHDLKNPFNTMLGFSQLLSKNIRKYDIDKIEQQVNIINNAAYNTYQLLEDILSWSRAQTGKIVYEPEDFNLNEACRSIIKEVISRAQSKNISVNCNIHDPLNVFTDIHLLKTVMRNLISNAIKFTHEGGTIAIDAKEKKDEIIVSVEDNGVGIDKKDLSELFNIVKDHTTKGTNNEEGTGLGLQICKEFVIKMGGEIWAESELGNLPASSPADRLGKAGGSVFYFTIPKQKNRKTS